MEGAVPGRRPTRSPMNDPAADKPPEGSGRRLGAFVLLAVCLSALGWIGWRVVSSRPTDTPPVEVQSGRLERDADATPTATDETFAVARPTQLPTRDDRAQDVAPPFVVEVYAPNRATAPPASPSPGARVAWLPRGAADERAATPGAAPARHEIERLTSERGGLATTGADGRVALALPDEDIELFAWTADAFASRVLSASMRRSLTRLRLVLSFDVALDVVVVAATGHGAAGVDVLVGREIAARTDAAGRARIERIRRFAPHPASSVQVATLNVDYPGCTDDATPSERLDPWQHPQPARTLMLPPTGSIEIAVHGDVPWTDARVRAIGPEPGFVRTFAYPRNGSDLSVVAPHVALGRRYAIEVDLPPQHGGVRAVTVDGPTTSGERIFVDLRATDVVRVIGRVVLDPAPSLPLSGQLELEIEGATHRWSADGAPDQRTSIGAVRTSVRADSTFEFVLPPVAFAQQRPKFRVTYLSETRGVSHAAECSVAFALGPETATIDLGVVSMFATQPLVEGVVVTAPGVTATVEAQRLVGNAPYGPALTNVPVDREGRFRVRMPSPAVAPWAVFTRRAVRVRATAPFHMPGVRVVDPGKTVRIELARAATLETTTIVPLAFGANVHPDDLRIELTPLPGTELPEHADASALVATAVEVLDAGDCFLLRHRFDAVAVGRYRVAHRVAGIGEVHDVADLPVVARETCEPTWLTFDLRDRVRIVNVAVNDPNGDRTTSGGHLEVRRGDEFGVFPLHGGVAAIPMAGRPIGVTACVDGFAPVTATAVDDDVVLRLTDRRACVLRVVAQDARPWPMRLVVVSLHGATSERDAAPAFTVDVAWPKSAPVDVPVPRPGRYRLIARVATEGEGGVASREREIDVVHVGAESATVRIADPWLAAYRRR